MRLFNFLIPFTIGVVLTVFIYQAFTIYQLRATAAENRQIILNDRAVIGDIVGFLKAKYPELQKQADDTDKAAAQAAAPAKATASSTKK